MVRGDHLTHLSKRFAAGALCPMLYLAVLGTGGKCQDSPERDSNRLTVDRLYSLPWLIGTKPVSPVWSRDSRRLAFLWNDEGTNFYDVWMTDVDSAHPVRVTRMPRLVMPRDPGADITELQQVEKAERDHGVSAVFWTPDGKSLLFNFHGVLFRVAPGGEPERLLDSGSRVSDAAPSPKLNRIAYLSQGDLWLADLSGAKPVATKLYTAGKKDVEVTEFHWSGDGSRIAFLETDSSNVPVRGIPNYLSHESSLTQVKRAFPGEPSERLRLGMVSANGAAKVTWANMGADLQDLIFAYAWSPDGHALLVDKSDLYIKDRRLVLVDPQSGAATMLIREADPKNVTAEWWADWALDGHGFYFISDRDNDYHVYYQALENGKAAGDPQRITSGNWAVFSAAILPHGLSLVTNEGKAEERQVVQVGFKTGAVFRVTREAGTHTPVSSPDGRYIADIFSSDATPPDLYLVGTSGAQPKQVTHSPLSEFKQYRWVRAQYVDFPNVSDGTMLCGRLTLPPDFDRRKKYPAILGSVYSNTVHNQWGGRIFHPTWGLDQYLAQQGYVILNVDISGSSGHGKAFRQRIGMDYGGVDVEDLYSGVRYLVSQGYVDEKRVGIWGSSYGGLLTTTSMFAKPGVYQAGVAGAPATSLFHALTGEMRTMMAPQDHQAEYAKSSAFLKSGGLQGHLMIIHGMKDEVVLFKDSVTLTERLILQGRDIELVPLPNAPHGWDTEGLAQTRYAFHRLVEYFQRYLGEGPR